VPELLVRSLLWLLTHAIYRIHVVGREHAPARGPALIVCNHVSYVDWLLVGASVPGVVRFVIHRPSYDVPVIRSLLRWIDAILVDDGSAEGASEAIARARLALERGQVVCLFVEGSISRTGNLLPFRRSLEQIAAGLPVPVIPVYLDGVWGSIFSFKGGRFFWKWPEQLPYPVTVGFGPPLSSTANAAEAREAIQAVGADAFPHRFDEDDALHLRFMRTARRHWRGFAMADSTGRRLTFGETLVGALLLSRWLRGSAGEPRMVGLMLPASVGGALGNVAAILAGKVPVNLNFTVGRDALESAIARCGIRTIVTSRTFLTKAKLGELPGMVFVEDALAATTTWQKVRTAVAARCLPITLLRRWYAPEPAGPETLATVIFSSGTTREPKGVMLSHLSVLANIEGLCQLFWVQPQDRIVGVLPFFHSFGFTGSLWLPLVAGFGAVYHPNPMDAQAIGELVDEHDATLLIATPTFCAAYLRKVPREQFASLRWAVVGAEKLREPIARAFREKYGLDLLEGYGCTEMAPVIAVNIPDIDALEQRGRKEGTVGHPLPGIAVKLVDPETGVKLPPASEGLLLVKGANRMLGYLGDEEGTRAALRHGWYVTGDIVKVDDDGFLTITDRLSRFSKIAGEMVPHLKVEEAMSHILDDQACVVTAVPDEAKGERLVAFFTRPDVSPHALWDRLNDSRMPKLWVPKRDNIHQVEALPLLGTGKVDLRRLRAMALELEGVDEAGRAS
jgi:acyl-[acyl-carrier-protein]-phospholipid O-acyltransferase / long-chain-fatty-acid--[acyl-carrier-protein] ligase